MPHKPRSWSGKGAEIGPCAMGAFNGLAFNSHQTWAFWHAEAVGMIESPFRCANGTRATMVSVRTLAPKLHGAERMRALIDGALEQLLPALSALRGDAPYALWLGLPERYSEHGAPGHLAERRRLETHLKAWCEQHAGGGPVISVPKGNASLAYALLEACAELAAGRLEAAIVGGVDTYHAPEVVEELLAQERLFDGKNLDSFIPGEGAAFLLLTRARTARRAHLPMLAHVDAVATGQEPGAMFVDAPCTGLGLAHAMRGATLHLPEEGRRLEWLLGDLTNESYRTTEFQLALPRAVAPGGLDSGGRDFRPIAAEEVQLDFLPLRFGDLGAATLPTAAVVASQAFMCGASEASGCLLVASSVGPDRGAVWLGRAAGGGAERVTKRAVAMWRASLGRQVTVMAMTTILCTLSPKRLALLQEEPELLSELLDSRHEEEIPGLLDLGKAWDALDRILSEGGRDELMADAILARKGQKLRAQGSYGPPRVLAPARVRQISAALAKLPSDLVASRYPSLQDQEVHGRYGQGHQESELAELEILLRGVVALYARAAQEGHSMMSVIA